MQQQSRNSDATEVDDRPALRCEYVELSGVQVVPPC
jgi:hypothetical protein